MCRTPAVLLALLVAVLPARADERPLTRIAFGSCLKQGKSQAIWGPLLASNPELFLFLGDAVYADTTDPDALRKSFAELGEVEEYQKLTRACPVLATWDDHDYGLNDTGGEHPNKKACQQVFLDFFREAKDSPRRTREGVYDARVFGPAGKRVQVILLDTRYHRSELKKAARLIPGRGNYVPNTDEGATILGAEQWKWLGEQLRVPAEVRLIGSSVQVVAEDHDFEKWMNFPREREKLYALLRDTKAAGVILLSGDRHLAELSVGEAGLGYPLYDLTSSGMNQANTRYRALETNRHRVATMDRGNNFGMILIDWSRGDPVLTLQIRDEDGDVTIGHKLPLGRLQPGKGKPIAKTGGPDLAAEAKKHVGKEWEVELTVAATGANKGKTMLFLNSDADFRSDRNLTVVLDTKALGKAFAEAKITDPLKHYKGKKLKVKGTVTLFKDGPQITIKSLDQITEVKE